MAGKRKQNKADERAAILAAARRCFIEASYNAVTIPDVVKAGGLAPGIFERHFSDKASLFRALIDASLVPVRNHIDASRRNAAGIEDLFHDAWLGVLQEVGKDPEFFAMALRNDAALRAICGDNIVGLMLQSLKTDLHDAIQRGALAPDATEILMAISRGTGVELCRRMIEHGDPRSMADEVTRLFIDGIGAAPQAAAQTPMIRIGSRKLRGAAR